MPVVSPARHSVWWLHRSRHIINALEQCAWLCSLCNSSGSPTCSLLISALPLRPAPFSFGTTMPLHSCTTPQRACLSKAALLALQQDILLRPAHQAAATLHAAGALRASWGMWGAFPRLESLYLSGNMLGDPDAPGGLPSSWAGSAGRKPFPFLKTMVLFPGNDNVCSWLDGSVQSGAHDLGVVVGRG